MNMNWIIESKEKNSGRKQYKLRNEIPFVCQVCSKEHYWSVAGDYFIKAKEVKEYLENDYCLGFFAYADCHKKRFLNQPLCYQCLKDKNSCRGVIKAKQILEKSKRVLTLDDKREREKKYRENNKEYARKYSKYYYLKKILENPNYNKENWKKREKNS